MHCFTTGLLLVVLLQLQLQFHQDLNLFNHDDGSTKNKRGVLPKHATNVMRSWLFQHIGVSPGHAPTVSVRVPERITVKQRDSAGWRHCAALRAVKGAFQLVNMLMS